MAYESHNKKRELKHIWSISKYVDEFSKLMLQIDNMNSNDLLFDFIEGLQLWAQWEFQRCQVNDISTALAEADTLVEFWKVNHPNQKMRISPNMAKVREQIEISRRSIMMVRKNRH